MRVIPAINVAPDDEKALIERLDAIREAADTVHLDVCDGTMTPGYETWRDADRWCELAGGLSLQAHLMVKDPEAIIGDWLAAGAKEIVVHLEPLLFPEDPEAEPYVIRLQRMREQCHEAGASLVIGGSYLIPSRPRLATRGYADAFLVLGVQPGLSGQEMDPLTLQIVRDLREAFEDVPVWVDGGVNQATLVALRDAGATDAVASSAVFAAEDAAAALAALQ